MEDRNQKVKLNASKSSRVKVYRRQTQDGNWEDQGTGHVTVDYMEKSEDLALFVIDEKDNKILLSHRICLDDLYQKEEDSIISWKNLEYPSESALSFQEKAGCLYIWDHICSVQRNSQFSTLNQESSNSANQLCELPAVELSTLPLILKTVVESSITDQLQLTELVLRDQDFIRKLMNLFKICEDLKNLDDLHMMYKIIKGILKLNNPQILGSLLGDEFIMDIVGCLEYDPENPHVRHRDFLTEHVVFKEVIPIRDPVVLSKIHQTYRIGYLKDVVLRRVLDDATVANLNSIVHANNGVVVSLLKEDNVFIQELFSRLKSASTSTETKKNLVCFLHEFCTLSKSLQMVQRLRLFRDLVNEGLFDIVSDILQNEDKSLVLIGADIMMLILNQDPNFLRSYVARPEGTPLLGLLVQGMLSDFGDVMHCQFLEILRTLLDSYTLSGLQRDDIIEVFYEKHLTQLIDVIISSCAGGGNNSAKHARENIVNQSNTKPEILLNICELLCFCVVHHPYRIKCNFLLNNLMDKVLFLTRRREKYLVVAAVRFMRTLISRNDESLGNYIVKRNLLKPIVDVFVANGDRNNLLNSAVLELFEYIRKEKPRPYIKYLVESFWNQLSNFNTLPSVHSLKVKYEQSLESTGANSSVNVEPTKRIDERALEKEEEDYFNEDSDEEDTASATVSHAGKVQTHPISSDGCTLSEPIISSKPGGLVDYDVNEDDEDYKPPPRRQTNPSDEDEGILQSFSMKRKLSLKEGSGLVKKRHLNKGRKLKESVFATLSSSRCQIVPPNKEAAIALALGDNISYLKMKSENCTSHDHKNSSSSSADEISQEEKVGPQNCSGTNANPQDNGQLEGRDHDHHHPGTNSTPEMAVNGS